jgi:hypothetical protein
MSLIKVGSSVVKTDAFSNKYEVVTSASTSVFNTGFDISSATVVVYVDGVRQQASAYSVSGARQITLSETVVSGTAVAISAMDTSPVTNLSAKANAASPVFTGTVDVNGQLLIRNTGVAYDAYNYGSSFTVEDTFFGNGNGKLGSDGKVGIGTVNPSAKLDVNGGLNIEDRLQIWRWAGNMSASSTIRLLDHSGQWLQSYCMVFVKVAAGWQNAAIWDVFVDGYGGSYCVSTKKMGDSSYHTVTTGATNNYGYINLNNLHTAQVAIEVNVYSFSSYATMNYTSSYMTLT